MKKSFLTRIKLIAIALSMLLTTGFSLTACDIGVNDVADVMQLKSRDQDLISFIVESAEQFVEDIVPYLTESITGFFEEEMAKENHGMIGDFLDTFDLPGLIEGYVEDNQSELLSMFRDMLISQGEDGSSLLDEDILKAIADSITGNDAMKDSIMNAILDMFDDEESDLANQLVDKIIKHDSLVSEEFIQKFVKSEAFLNALSDTENTEIIDALIGNPKFVDALIGNSDFVDKLIATSAFEKALEDAVAKYISQHPGAFIPGNNSEPRQDDSQQTAPTDTQNQDDSSAS